jgi:hypothetical protein
LCFLSAICCAFSLSEYLGSIPARLEGGLVKDASDKQRLDSQYDPAAQVQPTWQQARAFCPGSIHV